MKEFQRIEYGFLSIDGIETVRSFAQIIDGAKCLSIGGFHSAHINAMTQRQVDAAVTEVCIGLAVAKSFLPEVAKVHMNVIGKTPAGKDEFELESVVVVRNDGDVDETAYVIRCAQPPQIDKVKKLLKKVALFEKSPVAKLPPFSKCKSFKPILGGKLISNAVLSKCRAEKIGHMIASGAGFSLSTCARYAHKLVIRDISVSYVDTYFDDVNQIVWHFLFLLFVMISHRQLIRIFPQVNSIHLNSTAVAVLLDFCILSCRCTFCLINDHKLDGSVCRLNLIIVGV